ncbi:alkylhydroperoxidase [Pelistega indica]|uniref:Alkylhydroperoxidase n=1 Tax=Pelistega indica TaxID=1414851 RepID=V8G4W8_9BURK|nr:MULTISPECIES: carboxymuconolactone decarboxylase family protein [Pelistega]ETD71151.1 alkylhydroperoxidase [Pelistega indica]
MSKSYLEITQRVSSNMGKLRKEVPSVLKSFSDMAAASLVDGALSKKEKEFLALAIAVTQRCDPCIGFHTKALANLGATREEVAEALGVCVYMGGGPALMYAADAMQAFEEFTKAD